MDEGCAKSPVVEIDGLFYKREDIDSYLQHIDPVHPAAAPVTGHPADMIGVKKPDPTSRHERVMQLCDVLKRTLRDRNDGHGEYDEISQVTGTMHYNIRACRHYSEFTPEEKDAAYMILNKLARAASSPNMGTDNWLDIAGYAMLAMEGRDRIAFDSA